MKQLLAGEELQSLRKQINEQGEYFIQQQVVSESQNQPIIEENEQLKKENEQLRTALAKLIKKEKSRKAKKEEQLRLLIEHAKSKLDESECSILDQLLEAQMIFVKDKLYGA